MSATHSGVLIYPLLIGLVSGHQPRRRAPSTAGSSGGRRCSSAAGLAALGALGFGTFDAGTPMWQGLVFMALIGLGVGPALSGLQIALQRS